MMRTTSMFLILMIALLILSGCDAAPEQRVSELSQRYAERQAEQSRQSVALQQEVAAGSRELVTADAQARQELVALQRELHGQRGALDEQRDQLEAERKMLAASRSRESLLGPIFHNLGLIVLCLLPLTIGWLLLCQVGEPVSDQEVAELLLNDLVADEPQFSSTPLPRLAASSPEADASSDNTSGHLNP